MREVLHIPSFFFLLFFFCVCRSLGAVCIAGKKKEKRKKKPCFCNVSELCLKTLKQKVSSVLLRVCGPVLPTTSCNRKAGFGCDLACHIMSCHVKVQSHVHHSSFSFCFLSLWFMWLLTYSVISLSSSSSFSFTTSLSSSRLSLSLSSISPSLFSFSR